MGIVQGAAEGDHLIPVDGLAKTIQPQGNFFSLELGDRTVLRPRLHDQTHNFPVSLEQRVGIGPWGRGQDRTRMHDQAIGQLQRSACSLREDRVRSETPVSFQNTVQGPKEPCTELTAQLQDCSLYASHKCRGGSCHIITVGL